MPCMGFQLRRAVSCTGRRTHSCAHPGPCQPDSPEVDLDRVSARLRIGCERRHYRRQASAHCSHERQRAAARVGPCAARTGVVGWDRPPVSGQGPAPDTLAYYAGSHLSSSGPPRWSTCPSGRCRWMSGRAGTCNLQAAAAVRWAAVTRGAAGRGHAPRQPQVKHTRG
jgi:hypothetical protein